MFATSINFNKFCKYFISLSDNSVYQKKFPIKVSPL